MVTSKALQTCFLLWAFAACLSTASSSFQDETNPNAISPPPVGKRLEHLNDFIKFVFY
ncbi:hypothetical protein Hanom_Chr16g01505231 [Helianthus anomalus]